MKKPCSILFAFFVIILFSECARVPVKNYYTLNYMPAPLQDRMMDEPYPFVIRVKEFSIEEAYNRNQIVYRLSPFELRYYVYRAWAVRPTRMITDLVHKHLVSSNLVNSVVRRFDEGRRPDYELAGMIEALEEYDSEDITFAHIAMRISLTRLSDGATVYSRRFDLRRRVYQDEAEFVIRELSNILEYIVGNAIEDIDLKLAEEYGLKNVSETGEDQSEERFGSDSGKDQE